MERLRLTTLTTQTPIERPLDEVKLQQHGKVKFADIITLDGSSNTNANILELKSLQLKYILEEPCRNPAEILDSPMLLKRWMDKIKDMDLTATASASAPAPSFRLPNDHDQKLTLDDLFIKPQPTGLRIPVRQVIQMARLQLKEYCTCLMKGGLVDPRIHMAELGPGGAQGSLTPYIVVLIGGSKFYVQRFEPCGIPKLTSLPRE